MALAWDKIFNRKGLRKDKAEEGSGKHWMKENPKKVPTKIMKSLPGIQPPLSRCCRKRMKNEAKIHAV
jgi:hypothetical protein